MIYQGSLLCQQESPNDQHLLNRAVSKQSISHLQSPDSGYGSNDDNLINFDGSGSQGSTSPTAHRHRKRLFLDSNSPRPFPLPRVRQRSNTDTQCSVNKQNQQLGSGSRTPDRFIPIPNQCSSITERYHTGKQPCTLSKLERLLRQDFASLDPFVERHGSLPAHVSQVPPSSSAISMQINFGSL